MRSFSSSGDFDPGAPLGYVSTGLGGGIDDSDESDGVIESTRLVSEHCAERATGRQLMSSLAILKRNAQFHVSGEGGQVIVSALRGTNDAPN